MSLERSFWCYPKEALKPPDQKGLAEPRVQTSSNALPAAMCAVSPTPPGSSQGFHRE